MDDSYVRLIGALAADLRPVRRLPPPALRALFWLALVAAVAAALATFADVAAMWHRLAASPDMWLAVLGSIATAPQRRSLRLRSVCRIGPAPGRCCRCRQRRCG